MEQAQAQFKRLRLDDHVQGEKTASRPPAEKALQRYFFRRKTLAGSSANEKEAALHRSLQSIRPLTLPLTPKRSEMRQTYPSVSSRRLKSWTAAPRNHRVGFSVDRSLETVAGFCVVDDETSSGLSSNSDSYDEEHNGLTTLSTAEGQELAKTRNKIDILKLCEHMKAHGLGEPVMITSSHNLVREGLPPGVKARRLPRDPSTREKIKGRARLDYELANLRAVAFCEQQRPRAFRTASADMRNRDVIFAEEEEREQVHRELQDLERLDDGIGDVEDDANSLVGSPLSREELFCRIEAWASDVDKALHRVTSYSQEPP